MVLLWAINSHSQSLDIVLYYVAACTAVACGKMGLFASKFAKCRPSGGRSAIIRKLSEQEQLKICISHATVGCGDFWGCAGVPVKELTSFFLFSPRHPGQ